MIFEYAHWPPLAGQNQFRVTVVIQIAKHRAAHQASLLEKQIICFVGLKFFSNVPVKPRSGWHWILSGNDPTAQEYIQVPIPIEIAHGNRSDTRLVGRQDLFRTFSAWFVLMNATAAGQTILVIGRPNQQDGLSFVLPAR